MSRKPYMCHSCGQIGHNKRTCAKQQEKPTETSDAPQAPNPRTPATEEQLMNITDTVLGEGVYNNSDEGEPW